MGWQTTVFTRTRKKRRLPARQFNDEPEGDGVTADSKNSRLKHRQRHLFYTAQPHALASTATPPLGSRPAFCFEWFAVWVLFVRVVVSDVL